MLCVNPAVCFKLYSILTDIDRHTHVSVDNVAFGIHTIVGKTLYDSDPLTGSARCIQHNRNSLPVRSCLKNAFWPNIFVGASFQILDILKYACGLRPTKGI